MWMMMTQSYFELKGEMMMMMLNNVRIWKSNYAKLFWGETYNTAVNRHGHPFFN